MNMRGYGSGLTNNAKRYITLVPAPLQAYFILTYYNQINQADRNTIQQTHKHTFRRIEGYVDRRLEG